MQDFMFMVITNNFNIKQNHPVAWCSL